jgi:hypothetical protein
MPRNDDIQPDVGDAGRLPIIWLIAAGRRAAAIYVICERHVNAGKAE